MTLDEIIIGDVMDGLAKLPDESVHCVVTSPPYWGLRSYQENGKPLEGQIGLEKTPEEYVEKMVTVFREVRRVLRSDGTLWLNIGDSMASGKGKCHNPGGGAKSYIQEKERYPLDRANVSTLRESNLKPKDLVGIPWMVAFALRADGWYLRSDIIWSKPNPMPESVTDRPTKSHEYIFLLTKKARYFYDADAVRTPLKEPTNESAGFYGDWDKIKDGRTKAAHRRTPPSRAKGYTGPVSGANLRTVWTITTQPYPDAHFATFPESLPSKCIRAGTSEWGACPECGKQWKRAVADKSKGEKTPSGWATGPGGHNGKEGRYTKRHDGKTKSTYPEGSTAKRLAGLRQAAREEGGEYQSIKNTIGFFPDCACGYYVYGKYSIDPVPAIVLDPFMGSGTTAKVAQDLHRNWVGIDLGYKDMVTKRTEQGTLI